MRTLTGVPDFLNDTMRIDIRKFGVPFCVFLNRYKNKTRGDNSMNKVVLMGRLTKDSDVRYASGENGTAVARYTLAVDRRFKRDGEATADFIPCVAFGRQADVAGQYFRRGTKLTISGRIQTGSYTGKDGQKVYTTDVVIEEQEFAESKNAAENAPQDTQPQQRPAQPQQRTQAPQQRPVQQQQVPYPNQRYQQQPGRAQQQRYQQQNSGGYIGHSNYPAQPVRRGSAPDDGFMDIPDGEMEELPFN